MPKNLDLNLTDGLVRIEKTSLTTFSSDQFFTLYPHVYFKEEQSETALYATGTIAVFDHYPILENSSDIYLFFSGDRDSGALRAFIPKKIAFVSQDKIEVWEYNYPPIEYAHEPWEAPLSTKGSTYQLGVERLKILIQNRKIQKGVLAQVQPYSLPLGFSLQALEKHPSLGTKFYFKYTKELAFLGVTPEWLYKRDKRHITLEALAGTTDISRLEALETPKIIEEFTLVKRGILQAIQDLVKSGRFTPIDTYKTHHHLAHRYNCFTGILKDEVLDPELIIALHPTPAIIGLPKEQALTAIHTLEAFNRDYYASPVGYYTSSKARVAVAIRSAVIDQSRAFLYSGAGIVQDSIAEKEWEETQKKLRMMQSVLALGALES